MADKTKQRARALQKRTGWSYTECRRCVTTMSPEAIENLIKIRAGQKPKEGQ